MDTKNEDGDWVVYLLRCANDALYCGITNDIDRRLQVHRAGDGSKYVRSHLPVELAYLEDGHTHSTAAKREYEIKQFTKQKKEALVQSHNNNQ